MKVNNKIVIIVVAAIGTIAATAMYTHYYNRQHERLKVEVKPFKTNNGWGYNIMVDNKIFIHQENIPAFAGNQSFTSKDDAIKTANLVIKKLVAGNFPSLSAEEIMGLGINPILSSQ